MRSYCLTGGDGQVHASTHNGEHGDGRVCRPVVVFDPVNVPHLRDFADDPREALNIIADNVRDIAEGDLDATEQIVRWFADLIPKPPKPPEPTAWMAVVEDMSGNRWARMVEGGPSYVWGRKGNVSGPWLRYSEIDAVCVLSEGVTA